MPGCDLHPPSTRHGDTWRASLTSNDTLSVLGASTCSTQLPLTCEGSLAANSSNRGEAGGICSTVATTVPQAAAVPPPPTAVVIGALRAWRRPNGFCKLL